MKIITFMLELVADNANSSTVRDRFASYVREVKEMSKEEFLTKKGFYIKQINTI